MCSLLSPLRRPLDRYIPAFFRYYFFAISIIGLYPNLSSSDTPALIPLTEIEQYSEEWEYTSFLEDAGLQNRTIYYIDFDRNQGVWIAASDGLYYCNGYLWTRYTTENGLPSNMVRCVRVLRDGTIWVGTDRGAGTFDGQTFSTHGSETGLAGPSVRRITEDPDGSLWFCSDRYPEYNVPSGLSCYQNGQWTVYNEGNGFPSDHPIEYFRDSQGQQYVLTGNRGLLQKIGDHWTFPLAKNGLAKDENLWSIIELSPGRLFVTSYEGAYVLEDSGWRFENVFPFRRAFQLGRTRDGNLISFGVVNKKQTNYEMSLLVWNGERFIPLSSPMYPEDQWVEVIKEAPDGSIWCGGKDFLLRWTKGNLEWKAFKNFLRPRFIDDQENVWFTGDDTFIRLAPNGWEQPVAAKGMYRQDSQGGVWIWNAAVLTYWSKGVMRQYDLGVMKIREIKWWYADSSANVWFYGFLENGNSAFYVFANEKIASIDFPEIKNRYLPHIVEDPVEGIWVTLSTDRESYYQAARLTNLEIKEIMDIDIPFNNPPSIHVDRSGRIWIWDTINLYSKDPHEVREWKRVNETIGGVVFAIFEAFDALWFICDTGTYGQSGISRLFQNRWDHFADRIFTYKKMADDTLVFAGRKGVYVFEENGQDEPNRITLPHTGFLSGIVYEKEGVLWIQYENDVYRYQSDSIPPETLITAAPASVYQGDFLTADCRAVEWFLPHRVQKYYRYSWRIDAEPWCPLSSQTQIAVETNNLLVGNHVLEVRAVDEGLDIDPTPARWSFAVLSTPLQNRWWFWSAVTGIAGVILVLTLIAIALAVTANRSRKQALQERQALQWISQKLTGPLSVREIAHSAAAESKRIFRHDVFSLDVMDANHQKFQNVYKEETLPGGSAPVETVISIKEEIPNPADSYQRILAGESLLIERSGEGESGPFSETDRMSRRPRSMMFAPLIWQDQTIGIISVQSFSPGRYREHDLNLLKSFADNCSGALARVRAEDALEKSQAQLFQSQKMEAIGRLAGGVAHDFNNLLVAIMGYSEIALHEIEADSPIRKKIEEVIKAGNRAKSLTQQLLAFSRKQVIQPEVLHLNAVISDMFTLLQRLLGEDIEIRFDLDRSLGCVKVDRGQIEQIVVNLSVNARDAMPQGGLLVIQTQNVLLRTSAECGKAGIVPGAYVLLRVRDSGCGMDESIVKHIFEPFFSTKEKDKGTGLGLSTVYGILRQNGGGISVISSPGQGSEFSVYLPRTESELYEKKEEPASLDSLHGNETILLAEDQDQVRNLISGILREQGYTVLEAKNGAEALHIQAQFRNPIQLLITDIIMPGMSGVELSETLASQRPDIRTVFMTGYTDDILGERGALEPGMMLLQKPFTNQDLLSVIRKALSESTPS